MRRITLGLAIVVIVTLFAGCTGAEKIVLPFSSDEVVDLELYRFVVPAQAEQKIITSSSDIKNIMDKIQSTKIKEEEMEGVFGGETTSFRFNLNDGKTFEIICSPGQDLADSIKFSDSTTEYAAYSNLGAIWDRCKSEAISIEEAKLPIYNNPDAVDTNGSESAAYMEVIKFLADKGQGKYLALDIDSTNVDDREQLVSLLEEYCEQNKMTLLLDDRDGLIEAGYIESEDGMPTAFNDGFLISFDSTEMQLYKFVADAHIWYGNLGAEGGTFTVRKTNYKWVLDDSVINMWIS